MNKCVKCVFYKLTYNLSYCVKFNTFSEIARLDANKCGPELKYFKKKSLVNLYNKYTTNF